RGAAGKLRDAPRDCQSARGLVAHLRRKRENSPVHLVLILQKCRANEQKAVALHGRPRLLELSIIRTGHPVKRWATNDVRGGRRCSSAARHHSRRKMSSHRKCVPTTFVCDRGFAPQLRCFLKKSTARPHASSAALRSCTGARCSLTKAWSAS